MLANVQDRSAELRTLLGERIEPLPQVAEVRLEGLMGGVELHGAEERRGREVCKAAVERGVRCAPSATSWS